MPEGERSRHDHQVRDRFVELLRTEFRGMALATVVFLVIGTVLWMPGLLLIAGFGFTSGSLRQLARIPADRGNLQVAVAIFAAGLWATTIFVVALLPIALPVMVFNIVVPVVLAATYLDDRQHWPIALAGVAVAGVLGILGLTQPGLRMEAGVDEWVADWITIGFLVGYMWMFTATVRDANRTRVGILELALSTNEELVETQRQLRRSRRRLVEVADTERGRIERNLHDGAQQRLVSTAVQLKLAAQLADRGQVPTAESLGLLHDEVTAALHELRELAQGIYPSLLVERGLVEAVTSLARRSGLPAQVTGGLDGDLPDDLPDELESAVYFFCAEAIQNVTKHAGPDARLTVAFDMTSGADGREWLEVEVADTGLGFDPDEVADSRGMLNLRDRVEAIDGVLSVDAGPGRGATLRAVIPIGSRARSTVDEEVS